MTHVALSSSLKEIGRNRFDVVVALLYCYTAGVKQGVQIRVAQPDNKSELVKRLLLLHSIVFTYCNVHSLGRLFKGGGWTSITLYAPRYHIVRLVWVLLL